MLVRFDRPVEVLEDRVVWVTNGGSGQPNQWIAGIQSWQPGSRVSHGHIKLARLQVQQLVQLGKGALVVAPHLIKQLPVVDVGHVGDELGALVEPVQHDHYRYGFRHNPQVVLQPRKRIVIKTVKRFIQNEQFRTAGQRSDEHHLSRLTG